MKELKESKWKKFKARFNTLTNLFKIDEENQKYKDLLNKYSILFTLIFYLTFCLDVGVWLFSEIGNFTEAYFIAVIMFVIFMILYYVLVLIAKLKKKELISLFSFIYILGLELLSLVINYIPFLINYLGGLIIVSGVAYFSIIVWRKKKPSRKEKEPRKKNFLNSKTLTILLPILILGGSLFLIIFYIEILNLILWIIAVLCCLYAFYNFSYNFKNKLQEQIENRKKLIGFFIFVMVILICITSGCILIIIKILIDLL